MSKVIKIKRISEGRLAVLEKQSKIAKKVGIPHRPTLYTIIHEDSKEFMLRADITGHIYKLNKKTRTIKEERMHPLFYSDNSWVMKRKLKWTCRW